MKGYIFDKKLHFEKGSAFNKNFIEATNITKQILKQVSFPEINSYDIVQNEQCDAILHVSTLSFQPLSVSITHNFKLHLRFPSLKT